jgi:peptidoglycan hydrolase CwlO-like protein
MKKELLCLVLLLLMSLSTHAQATKKYIDTGSVNNQFDYLIDKSYRYKNFKNVDLSWLNKLKANVADSLNATHIEIQNANGIIQKQKNTIDNLKSSLDDSTNKISALEGEIQSISLLGIQFKKAAFKTILFTIIGALAFLLVVFMGKYKRSNQVTKETKDNLKEVEEEFEIHRKRALEREQKVMRKLQDELNKQKKD